MAWYILLKENVTELELSQISISVFYIKDTATDSVAKYVGEEGWKDQCEQLSFLVNLN